MIVMRRHVQVDGKVRTDLNFPAGFMDVVTIQATNEQFRLLYDVKGRFALHRITPEEAKYKLCRIQKIDQAKKASIGRNPFVHGQKAVIPYAVTHDGRTLRFADPIWKVSDVLKIDIATGKPVQHLKFEVGALCMVTKGANQGRIGVIESKERHEGGFDIVHIKDKKDQKFVTRLSNVFVIGEKEDDPWVSLPKNKGIRTTIIDEYNKRVLQKEKH